MALPQDTYELHVRGLKRTISNIDVITADTFKGYFYNYHISVEKRKKPLRWLTKCTSPGGELLCDIGLPSSSSLDGAVKYCVEKILDHYSQNHIATHGKSSKQEQTAS